MTIALSRLASHRSGRVKMAELLPSRVSRPSPAKCKEVSERENRIRHHYPSYAKGHCPMTLRSKVLDLNAGEPSSAAAGSTLRVKSDPAKSRQRLLTDIGYSAVVPNVTTANAFLKKIAGELDLTESVAVMSEKAKAASAGILTDLETMLAAQAVALKTVFNNWRGETVRIWVSICTTRFTYAWR